jgi:hypothetical protein
MNETLRRIALAGSWHDAVGDRRSVAAELARAWSHHDRLTVFADTSPATRADLVDAGARCWPEGAFGRHFSHGDFGHAVLMIGPRLDSLLALARSADEGAHVWLQDSALDVADAPIDAPDEWLAEVLSAARSVIVGSDWSAGVVRRIRPDGPPVLVMPPAHPNVDPVIEPADRTVVVVGADAEVRQYLSATLAAHIVPLDDDDMTPDVVEARLLSARAGIEIRTSERGFASTTVTHMTARGIPTITNLSAHVAFASDDLTSSGLAVVDHDDHMLDRIVAHLAPTLDDDRHWLAASTAAKSTATRWTWADAADVLAQWIDAVDTLEPSTVRVVGAVAS